MAVFAVYLNVSGKKMEVGSVALENPNLNEIESVELVEQDAASTEGAISVSFAPAKFN